MPIPVKIKLLSPQLKQLPQSATSGSAGLDLCACLEAPQILHPGEIQIIPTGIAIALPSPAYVALLFARSGLATRHGIALANGVGVIDSDYRGEIRVAILNQSQIPYEIQPMERICQLLLLPVEQAAFLPVDTLDETCRGAGGFGSTGL